MFERHKYLLKGILKRTNVFCFKKSFELPLAKQSMMCILCKMFKNFAEIIDENQYYFKNINFR